jgi:hypothetical protein
VRIRRERQPDCHRVEVVVAPTRSVDSQPATRPARTVTSELTAGAESHSPPGGRRRGCRCHAGASPVRRRGAGRRQAPAGRLAPATRMFRRSSCR